MAPREPKNECGIKKPRQKPLERCFDGAPGRIRTPGPQIRSLVLYPAELPVRSHQRPPSTTCERSLSGGVRRNLIRLLYESKREIAFSC